MICVGAFIFLCVTHARSHYLFMCVHARLIWKCQLRTVVPTAPPGAVYSLSIVSVMVNFKETQVFFSVILLVLHIQTSVSILLVLINQIRGVLILS